MFQRCRLSVFLHLLQKCFFNPSLCCYNECIPERLIYLFCCPWLHVTHEKALSFFLTFFPKHLLVWSFCKPFNANSAAWDLFRFLIRNVSLIQSISNTRGPNVRNNIHIKDMSLNSVVSNQVHCGFTYWLGIEWGFWTGWYCKHSHQ